MLAHTSSRVRVGGNAFCSFRGRWKHIFEDSPLSDVTPRVLRHSFASIANDLGFTEVTIAGHAKGSVTSKYIHTRDPTLIMAAGVLGTRSSLRPLDCEGDTMEHHLGARDATVVRCISAAMQLSAQV